ncbi:MAG: hypothetical protein AAGN46_05340 [Acidobacteriota bacterium]
MQLDQASLASRRGLLIFSTLCLASSAIGIFPTRVLALGIELDRVEGHIYVALGAFTTLSLLSFESRVSAHRKLHEDSAIEVSYYFSEIFIPKLIANFALLSLLFINPSKSPFYSAWQPFGETATIIVASAQKDLAILFSEHPMTVLSALFLMILLLFWRNELGLFWHPAIALSIIYLLTTVDYQKHEYYWRVELKQEWLAALFPSPVHIINFASIATLLLIIIMYFIFQKMHAQGKTQQQLSSSQESSSAECDEAVKTSRVERALIRNLSKGYLISSEVLASDGEEEVSGLRFDITEKREEPTTDDSRQQDLAFVIADEESGEELVEIAHEVSHGRLRRLFLVLVQEERVKELSQKRPWTTRAETGTITDRALDRGLNVLALLEAANNDWSRYVGKVPHRSASEGDNQKTGTTKAT